MLDPAEKKEILDTFMIELERMMKIIDHKFNKKGTPSHRAYVAKIKKNWSSCIKQEADDLKLFTDYGKAVSGDGPINETSAP